MPRPGKSQTHRDEMVAHGLGSPSWMQLLPHLPTKAGEVGEGLSPHSMKLRLAWDPNFWLAASQAVPHSLLQGNRGSETAHKLLKVTELGLKPRLLSVTSYLFAPLL